MLVLTRLRYIRERQGLSQTDLAARSGVTQATISNLEKGRAARFVTMRKLAAALSVEPSALIDDNTRRTTGRGASSPEVEP